MEYYNTDLIQKLKSKDIVIPSNLSDDEFFRWYKRMLKIHGLKPKKITI